jgi:hypothetical protein
MRADEVISEHVNQPLPAIQESQPLTPAQSAFADVLGRILAARWAAAHPLIVSAPPRGPEATGQTDRRGN